MKYKIILLTTMFLIFISLASAANCSDIIYSGDTCEMGLEEQYDYYSIVGNTSEVNIEVTQDSENVVTISIDKYSIGDTFELIFFNKEIEVVTEHHYSSGGGSSSSGGGTRYVEVEKKVIEYRDVVIPGETEIIQISNTVEVMPEWIWGLIVTITLIILVTIILVLKKGTENIIEKEV